jgi:hypothetical protein
LDGGSERTSDFAVREIQFQRRLSQRHTEFSKEVKV